jgi:mannose-6-phosphate isomerase-like protein (cupin superfamily)
MDYKIHPDIKFRPLELIDTGKLSDECADRWWNQSLCLVNDCVMRLGVFEGEFHWHKHELEDEFFFVLEGSLLLDLEDRTIELAPRQGMLVPRGVPHRTRALVRTVVLMIEATTVNPTGD